VLPVLSDNFITKIKVNLIANELKHKYATVKKREKFIYRYWAVLYRPDAINIIAILYHAITKSLTWFAVKLSKISQKNYRRSNLLLDFYFIVMCQSHRTKSLHHEAFYLSSAQILTFYVG